MPKISRVTRCLCLPRNLRGRDLVVGDLHGHLARFEQALERVGFDPAIDRVLSVGDLIDRGPESLATLALIEQPWFFAVLGNHELMLLNLLGYYGSRRHARKSYATGSGAWILDAMARERKRISRLADAVAALPLALHIDSDIAFNVMHGDLCALGSRQDRLFASETISVHAAEDVSSSRANLAGASKDGLRLLPFDRQAVALSASPLTELPITYVGHSPTRHITVHNSHVYIEQGVCADPSKRAASTAPTLLDHWEFARWLDGVAAAPVAVARPSDRPRHLRMTRRVDAARSTATPQA